MAEDQYIFADTAEAREFERLQALEAIFDPATERYLALAGPLLGRRCLEVGAGAGSIAGFLHRHAGSEGRVVAIDTNTRFLQTLRGTIEIWEGDVRHAPVRHESFDVAHARYVLVHNSDPESLIDAMLAGLKPGGFILLEEPDFSVALALAAPTELQEAFEKVSRAIHATFKGRQMDPALGRRLPSLVQRRGVELVAIDCEAPVAPGASPLAKMMALSAHQLRPIYLATGCVTEEDLAAYATLTQTPTCFAIYYSTVRVLGRKPSHA